MGGFGASLYNSDLFGPISNTGVPFGSGPGSIAYTALRYAGQLRSGATASPEMLADTLYECNAMIDGWNAQELTQQFMDDRYFSISVSQPAYTLGPTGQINSDVNGNPLTYRPQRIVRANMVLLTNVVSPVRIPIQIIPIEDYADIPVLQIASQVSIRMYVQTTPQNVTIYLFPFPTVGNQIELFMWPGYNIFGSLAAQFIGNPGYQDAITWNLAYRMYMMRDKEVGDPRQANSRERYLHYKAVETLRIVEASNAPTPNLTPDIQTEVEGGNGSPFNYLYGDWSQ